MADRRMANAVLLGPTGEVILDLTQSRPPFSGVGILDASGNVLVDLSLTNPPMTLGGLLNANGGLQTPTSFLDRIVADFYGGSLGVGSADPPTTTKTAGYGLGVTTAGLLDLFAPLGFRLYQIQSVTNPALIIGPTNYEVRTNSNTLDDGSGNLTANTLASTVATGTAPLSVASTTEVANLNSEQWGGAKNDIVSFEPPTSPSSFTTSALTAVSAGNGTSFIPSSSKVYITSNVRVYNSTAGISTFAFIYRNSTGIPSAGTAVGSDVEIAQAYGTGYNAGIFTSLALIGLDTGLTPGETYYYYWAIASASSAGSSTIGFAGNFAVMVLRSS